MSELLPSPEVRQQNRISKAWLIPILAAAVAGWMLVTNYLQLGPSVEISFLSAEGLVAGKTAIRHKSIQVGEVEEIRLSDDLSQVLVSARLDRTMEDFLADGSRFWVVKPRVGPGGVSGLDTLLSGSYIQFEPIAGPRADRFVGLEKPPTTPAEAGGLHLVLRAKSLGSVSVGVPILYRDIPVGKVESYRLLDESVEISAYVDESHEALIRRGTRFWEVSGVEVAMDSTGFRVQTSSVDSLIRGGIAFETPFGAGAGEPVANGAEFQLYSAYKEIGEEYVGDSIEAILYFENSVRGLRIGAPVEFRGIQIGEVTDVQLRYHLEKTWLQIPVRAKLQPQRLKMVGGEGDQPDFEKTLEMMIERGLRARVATGNLLTGAMFVDLDFDGDAPLIIRGEPGDPLEIPTQDSGTDELVDNLSELVKKLEKMPLDDLVRGSRGVLVTAREVIQGVGNRANTLLTTANGTLAKVEGTLETVDGTLATANAAAADVQRAASGVDPATVQDELLRVLRDAGKAAASIKRLADLLTRQPESLLRGKR